jgi:dihydrofolate reductase
LEFDERMHVVLLAVVSLDGCLTRHDAVGATGLSSDADHQHFVATLATCDASICGRATYEGERTRLLRIVRSGQTTRRRIVMTRQPDRYADDAVSGLLEFRSATPAQILDDLRADDRKRVAILGGGEIYSQFLADGLVDEMSITIEARIFGTGIRLAGTSTPIDPSFELQSVQQIGPGTVLLGLQRSAT